MNRNASYITQPMSLPARYVPSATTKTINNMDPTPYRVSTITCNATISTKVDLSMFFENVRINSETGFVWTEYGALNRGVRPKKKKTPGDDKAKKSFDNQVTVIYRIGPDYCPNLKLFRNGNIHMTGIRTPKDGERMMEVIAEEVRHIAGQGVPIVAEIADVKAADFQIRMINCDFGFPTKLRRKNLHQIIITKYHNMCSFQPPYPGVKLQYYWNSTHPVKDGICRCKSECFGKGNGCGDGQCKKVTVAIFDSGKILITGANAFDQVNDAYSYICGIVRTHAEEVRKLLPAPRTEV